MTARRAIAVVFFVDGALFASWASRIPALGLGLSAPTLFRSAAGQPGVATAPALATVSAIGYTGFLAGPPIVGGVTQLTSLRLACGLCVLAGLLVLGLARAARPAAAEPRSASVVTAG